jgi:hypothetical protein
MDYDYINQTKKRIADQMYDTQKNMGIDEHKIIKYGSENKRMSLVPHLAEK